MPAKKVLRITAPDGRKFLVGCSGCAYASTSFVAWLQGGDKPSLASDVEFCAMVVDERRRVWMLGRELVYLQINMPQWAIGSGADYALGAMAAGADPERAVRIASRLDVSCGLGVNVVRF